jgi:hypothetical protein
MPNAKLEHLCCENVELYPRNGLVRWAKTPTRRAHRPCTVPALMVTLPPSLVEAAHVVVALPTLRRLR